MPARSKYVFAWRGIPMQAALLPRESTVSRKGIKISAPISRVGANALKLINGERRLAGLGLKQVTP